jgi:hypothetical protein
MDTPSFKEDHIIQLPALQMLVNLTPPTLTHTLIPPHTPSLQIQIHHEDDDWKDNYYINTDLFNLLQHVNQL